jgi:hypothetical protein
VCDSVAKSCLQFWRFWIPESTSYEIGLEVHGIVNELTVSADCIRLERCRINALDDPVCENDTK